VILSFFGCYGKSTLAVAAPITNVLIWGPILKSFEHNAAVLFPAPQLCPTHQSHPEPVK
jgi:hypothetical protein